MVIGDLDNEVQLVMNGKGMMPAFGQMLSAVDFAAVITFTRNGLGNNVGDVLQPSAVQPLLANSPEDEDEDDEG